MPVRSLRSMATATAIRHVKALDDLGALPYILARPILQKVDNAEKLRTIELASPHLAEEDSEIWMDIIKRDIPRWETYQLPAESNDWYNIYCDLREQTERALDADAEMMRKAIDGINNKRAALTPQIIPQSKSHRMAHARPSARQRHAAYDRKMGGISTDAGLHIPRSEFGPKKKNNIFQPTRRNNALTVPTKALSNRSSQVQRAPRALIEDHQVARRPTQQKPHAPPKPPSVAASLQQQHAMLARNEDKLRALTGGTVRAEPNPGSKRRATSPPPSSSSSRREPQPSPSSGPSTSGPIMRRRPPPSIFMPPKRRRV
ncbi:RNA polymerase II transcription factor SIII subunit A [Penicillium brevicompactum]|uniref:RNA polymerase II transcription factor SIII subunit A n=1 Tax=Penicillium brevicompactum TaxID=5074 RepID=A0A9W9RUJ4_PENBR|nr:RNA polymerase II transcription factor SIII subunit A [Penicillium brevicompactum]